MFSFSCHKYFKFTDYFFTMPELECLQWGSYSSIHTNTMMETLVLEMSDETICTTNVKQNKGFDKKQGIIQTCLKSQARSLYTCNRMLSKHGGGTGRHKHKDSIDNGPKSQLEQSWDGDSPARTAREKQTL